MNKLQNSLLFLLLAALFMPLALHAQQSLPYSCGFEDDDDFDGWELYATNQSHTGLYNSEVYAHSGTHVIGIYYDEENAYLVSPIFTGGDNGINVSFWYYELTNQYGDEQFEVGYTTDESIEDPSQFTYDGDVVTAAMEWQEYTFTFPAGTKRIAVHYIPNDAYYLFLDDFEFTAVGAAVCNRPTGLTANNVGSRTATISWTSDASAWQICVNDNETNLINVNQTSYTLSGLTPETAYTVKVRTNCGNNNFSAWTNVSFNTEAACPAPEDLTVTDISASSASISWVSGNNCQLRYRIAPANIDFEDGSLGNWTTIDADGDGNNWYPLAVEDIAGHDGSVGMATSASYAGYALTPDNYLVSPQIILGGSISFYACAQDANWAAEHFGVAISTNGNIDAASFTTIQEWTMNAKGSRDQGAWGLYTVDLSAYSGQGYVAIRHFDCSDLFRLNVDDITIVQPGITEPQPWNTIDNNVSNPYALTGLSPETTYQVQVRSNCTSNNEGYSEWTNAFFTTLPSCVAPTDLTITNITTSSALITWTGSANSYNLKVNGVEYNNVTNPYTLRNLTAATLYTVEVQSVCSASNTSSWTTETFVTEYCEEADKCLLTFVLGDSYGDGWNNAYIDIIDAATNMSIANMAALSHGGGSVQSYDTFTLAVCDGRDIKFVWHTGSWDGETSFIVNDVNGDEIFSGSGSNFSNNAVISTYTVDCVITSCRKPTDLQATDISANSVTLSWTENGEATAWVVSYSSGDSFQTANATETTMTIPVNPETSYTAKVRPVCDVDDKWSNEISFTTPPTCPLPNGITIASGAKSTTLNWIGSSDSYNVRYRLSTASGFDDGVLGDWTTIDADGDGNTWFASNSLPGNDGSNGCVSSASYINNVDPFTPDNYLVSPQVTLGGSISFYACAQDASWPSEHFGVAISTKGNTDVTDFTTIAEWTMNADGTGTKTQGAWGCFTVDLGAYSGQGYVAIRHFNCTDMYSLNVDDINITPPGVENPWIATLSTTENTITLSNLQMATSYEYQIQSVCDGTPTAWSVSNYFSTLSGNIFIIDGEWNNGDNWTGGTIPIEGSNVTIQADVTIPSGFTANAGKITIAEGGSLTIQDGGQLIHANAGVNATIKKNIVGYGEGSGNYYLLTAPIRNDMNPAEVENMVNGDFDLYAFDGIQDGAEWRNYKVEPFYMARGYGYLYANKEDVTLSFTGELFAFPESGYVNMITGECLGYTTDEHPFANWYLVGNPHPCDAYIVMCDETGTNLYPVSGYTDFYKMNEEGTEIIAATGPVAPMEGVFVISQASTNIVVTSAVPYRGSYMNLNLSQGNHVIDAARIRFANGEGMEKIQLNPKHTKLYIPQNGRDYSVVYSEGIGEMPVNFQAEKNGSYTLSFGNEEVKFSYLHLIDNLTGNDVDLLQTPNYTFEACTTDYVSRFKLVFATGETENDGNFAFISNGNIIVNGEGTLQIFDALGRQLFAKELPTANCQLPTAAGVYVLRLINGDNAKIQKIVIQ